MYKDIKANNFLKNIQPEKIPIMKRAVVYLLIPAYLLLNLNREISAYLPQVDYVYVKFLIALLGATYAYKDLEPYIRNVNGFNNTIKVSVKLVLAEALFTTVILLLVGKDPQNLQGIKIMNLEYYKFLLELPFTAIGEEVLKALMLLAFIRIFKSFINKKVIIAIILSAIVFGALHINYNYENSFNIILSIGFAAIPSLVFLLYYKSIYPAIIVHFIHDLVAVSYYSVNFIWIYMIFESVCMVGAIIWVFNKGIKT